MIKRQIDEALNREMDRKDFLKHVGLAIIAVMGVSAMLQSLGMFGQSADSKTRGYGSSPYGR